MLQRLSEQMRNCHERAAEARRKADASADPASRDNFLHMETRWLALARSYAFTECLGDFTLAMSDRRRNLEEHGQDEAGSEAALRLQEISTLSSRTTMSTPCMGASSTWPSG